MPFCPKCGREVSEDTKFCPECGQKLKEGFSPGDRQKYIEELKASVEGEKPPKKTKITRKKLAGIIGGCIIAVIVIAVIAIPSEPTPTPLPVTTTSEPPIPAHFTTYTDELGLFSISYPPDWELGLSRLKDLEQLTKELIKNIESDAPVERQSAIFNAGVPTEMGYSPNVNIVVESLPGVGWTLDKVAEAYIQATKNFIQDYYEFSRVKTIIGGRDAIIIDYEGTFPGLSKLHWLQMVTLVGKTSWVVTCAASPEEFSKWEYDLHAIVRSLRILK